MRIEFCRKRLLNLCQLAALALSKNPPRPSLNNFLIKTTNRGATICATNLEVFVEVSLQGVGGKDQVVLVDAAKFISALKECTTDQVDIETQGDQVASLLSAGVKFKFVAADPEKLPQAEAIPEQGLLSVPAGSLAESIRRTLAFTGGENAQPEATSGVSLVVRKNELRLAATNGRRLAVAMCHTTEDLGEPVPPAVVPAAAMRILERALADCGLDEIVKFFVRKTDVFFRAGSVDVYARTLQGKFPNYSEALPKKFLGKTVLLGKRILTMARQAAVMCEGLGDKNGCKKITMEFSANKLVVEGTGSGHVRIEEKIEYAGPETTINLNAQMLIEFANHLPEEDAIEVGVNSASDAMSLVSGPGGAYQHLIMPLT